MEKPQVITSPDGDIQLINYKIVTSMFGDMFAVGTVKNISLKSNLSAIVKADYYDARGNYIDSETDTIRRLEPGKYAAFEVVYSGQIRYRIKNLKLSVNTIGKM